MNDQFFTLDAKQVRKLVADARATSKRTWVPETSCGGESIESVRARFDASLIEPEKGWITVEPHVAEILGIPAGRIPVWFSTAPGTQRVFLDEREQLFGVAWGPGTTTGEYVDLGFRTDDPVDAFLA